jgi:NitT/TauT family transport system permease protein
MPLFNAIWNVFLRWWFPLFLVVLWEIALKAGLLDHSFFPAPSSLLVIAWQDLLSGKLLQDSLASTERLAAGMAIGLFLGVTLGLVMALWRPVDLMLGSLVQVLRAIPPITWIGFSILWFGLGNKPAIFLIALGVVFPILLNTYAGIKQVDQIYLRAAHNLGAHGWMLFKDVVLAAALPSILTGLRVAMGLGWILVVVSELIAVPSGLGNSLMRAQDYGLTDRMLAYMLVIGLFGYLCDLLVMSLTRHLLRWQRSMEAA